MRPAAGSFGEAFRRSLGAPAGVALVIVVATVVLLGLRTPWSATILGIAVAALVAAAAWLEVRLVLAAHPLARRVAVPEPPAGALPEQLERLRRTALLAPSSELDTWVRLRPLLQPIVRDRLRRSRHLDLDAEPERVREVLGERLEWLVGARRSQPEPGGRRLAPGQIEQLVAAVEALAGDADR